MAIDSSLLSSQFNLLSRISSLSLLSTLTQKVGASQNNLAGAISAATGTTGLQFNVAGSVNSAAAGLASAAQKLTDTSINSVLNSKKVQAEGSTGDKAAFTATASSLATAGEEYDLDINQLATAKAVQTSAVSAAGASALAPGVQTIEITPQGESTGQTYSVTVNPGDTNQTVLDNLAAEINSREGYTAEVVDVGGGNIHLTLTGQDTGETATYTVSDLSGSLASTYQLDSTATVTSNDTTGGVTQAAVNAEFSINGVTQESPTNTVTVAQGTLTIEFEDTTQDNVVLTVTSDVEGTVEAVKDFAEAYNKQLDAYDKNPSFANSVSSQNLKNATFLNQDTLRDLGVEIDPAGRLEVDEEALTQAAEENPADIKEAFAGLSGVATLANSVATAELSSPLVFGKNGTGSLFGGSGSSSQFGLSSLSSLNSLTASNIGFFLSFFA